MCVQTRVAELGVRIQPGPNGAFDTCVIDKKIEGRDGAVLTAIQYTIVHVGEGLDSPSEKVTSEKVGREVGTKAASLDLIHLQAPLRVC